MRVGPHNGVLVALQEDQEKTQVHILANNTLCCNKARRPWPDATTTVRDFLASISHPDKSLSLSDFCNSGRKLTKARLESNSKFKFPSEASIGVGRPGRSEDLHALGI